MFERKGNIMIQQRATYIFSVLLLICGSSMCAQIPTLEAEKTVNPQTGEMRFSLPLGTVPGLNGNDFPVSCAKSHHPSGNR